MLHISLDLLPCALHVGEYMHQEGFEDLSLQNLGIQKAIHRLCWHISPSSFDDYIFTVDESHAKMVKGTCVEQEWLLDKMITQTPQEEPSRTIGQRCTRRKCYMGLGDFNQYYQDDDDEAPDNVPNIPTTSHGRGKKARGRLRGRCNN